MGCWWYYLDFTWFYMISPHYQQVFFFWFVSKRRRFWRSREFHSPLQVIDNAWAKMAVCRVIELILQLWSWWGWWIFWRFQSSHKTFKENTKVDSWFFPDIVHWPSKIAFCSQTKRQQMLITADHWSSPGPWNVLKLLKVPHDSESSAGWGPSAEGAGKDGWICSESKACSPNFEKCPLHKECLGIFYDFYGSEFSGIAFWESEPVDSLDHRAGRRECFTLFFTKSQGPWN